MSEVADPAKERILEAAGAIFADKGFDGATVREICAAADVNVAAVNYYFGDKRRLYFAAVRRAHDCRAAPHPLFDELSGEAPEVRLRTFVVALLHRMLSDDRRGEEPWQSRLMLREVLRPSDACRELVEDHFRPQFEMLLGLLREIAGASADEHFIRRLGFSVVGQCLYYRMAGEVAAMLTPESAPAEEYALPRLAEHIAHVAVAACRAAESPATEETSSKSNEIVKSQRNLAKDRRE